MMAPTSRAASHADNRPVLPRAGSIDSTASSISTNTSASHRLNGNLSYRVTSEATAPNDVASLIAAAGSPEAAIQRLVAEKASAASHNAQLWRLVEKQRAMILGLNKDLEKSLKEKERYRKKLKDHLVTSTSAPLLTADRYNIDPFARTDPSQSPPLGQSARPVAFPATRDLSTNSRKVSDASDAASTTPGRSDTPQDAASLSALLPSTPQSVDSTASTAKTLDRNTSSSAASTVVPPVGVTAATPVSPPTTSVPLPSKMAGASQKLSAARQQQEKFTSSPSTANPSSGVKNATRKAPPAPLDLSPRVVQPSIFNPVLDASESEYEDDPESARAEQMLRGRRKTREEDDREREALARQEDELLSKPKKEEKSSSMGNSKGQPPREGRVARDVAPSGNSDAARSEMMDVKPKQSSYQDTADPVAMLRQRAVSDAAGLLPRHATAPALSSPGLPMSPRPGDRPMNSPMPRPPNKTINSIPMSPRAGLPLSPRPPKQPLPMPPQTPLSLASPHLARAEQYQQQALASQGSINNLLKPSPDPSPDKERASTSIDVKTPGEVYKGLVTEQYPDLLLPPNALASIFVKTASSRMRPSRQSFIAPKHNDDNPVFTIGVHQRSDGRQLWRAEKTLHALSGVDQKVKLSTSFRDRMPDKTLFAGHAPAKIDARRIALDSYFERMLDTIVDERAAKVVCKFLSTDVLAAEGGDYFSTTVEPQPGTPMSPVNKTRPRREGYLTKRGKNFGGWKARYFVLDGPTLKYFEAPGGAQLGVIRLQSAQIGKQAPAASHSSAEDEENQFRHAFLILEPKRKDSTSLVRHVLCAESDEERDLWVDSLLQYVEWNDDGEDVGRGTPIVNGPRSPRLQRSANELRPPSRAGEAKESRLGDSLRSVGYDQMIAGDAPLMGGPNGRKADITPPPIEGSPNDQQPHPQISGPSNAHVIRDAGEWGMRHPPTPGVLHKDNKKRGLFNFRGRSSSDLAPSDKVTSPGHSSENQSLPRAVFGVPLAEAVQNARTAGVDTELPAVVYRCFEYLVEKDAMDEEGIFRLSGSNTVIKALRDRFNNEGDVNLVAEGKYHDIHAVAGLLKLYLRELPASILTRDLHLDFLKCLEMDERDKIASLNVLVNRLPSPNRALLETLSGFLLSIVNNADVNKMNVRNGKFLISVFAHNSY